MKTNAARILDAMGISYQLRDYEVDPEDLTAETVARKIQLPLDQVFKTLVLLGDRAGHCFGVLPGNAEVDLKALARQTGDRAIALAPLREVQNLTGYIRGAVTVFGARKPFPVFADETLELWDVISVSSGVRGTQVLLSPADYLRATQARLCSITKLLSRTE